MKQLSSQHINPLAIRCIPSPIHLNQYFLEYQTATDGFYNSAKDLDKITKRLFDPGIYSLLLT